MLQNLLKNSENESVIDIEGVSNEAREAVLTCLQSGVCGTNQEINPSKNEQRKPIALPMLLGYSKNTTDQARILVTSLSEPLDFDLVESSKINPLIPTEPQSIPNGEHGNVLHNQTSDGKGITHTLTFPTTSTNPYLGGYEYNDYQNRFYRPDIRTILTLYELNQQIRYAKLSYLFNPANNPLADLEDTNSLAKDISRRANQSFPTYRNTELIAPEKHSLLNFYFLEKRMSPRELYSQIMVTNEQRIMSYMVNDKNNNGFDTLTIAYNRETIKAMARHTLENETDDASRKYLETILGLYARIKIDPQFQVVGIGKTVINDRLFYVYTGADKNGITLTDKSKQQTAIKTLLSHGLTSGSFA